MWGSKPGTGYSEQMYRDRNAGGFETKGKCCCFYLTRSVVVILATSVIIAAGAASVLSVVFGYKERWTYGVNRDVNPPFNIRTGWLYFSDNRRADRLKLDDLSKAVYILGIVAVAMNCLSAIVALWTGLKAMCGRVGRGFSCFAVIFSIALVGTMIAYYIVTALQVFKYSQRVVNAGKFPWPDWAWCLSAGSALLWLIAAGLASAMPTKSKYFAEEAEFQRQRLDPERPYQVPPPPIARGTPVDGFVPSTMEPVQSTRNVPPMASQENVDHGTEPKKSFMPSWTKRNSQNTEASIPTRSGNLKSRADEIRDRYRNQGKSADVEMGTANTERPKSAW